MKKALTLLLLTLPFSAFAEKDYVAKLDDDGKYCARVEVQTIGSLPAKKRFCRTLEEWKEAGYAVSAPVKKSQNG